MTVNAPAMKWKASTSLFLLFCEIGLAFLSCSPRYHQYVSQYNFKSRDGAPDYSDLKYWAAHPHKRDPSDSVPFPLRFTTPDSTVDVFFLHPTTYTRKLKTDNFNADIDDASTNAKTDYSSILYQASVFNGQCRVFAPRYRQAHIAMYFHSDTNEAKLAFDSAYVDVKKAFEYYLNHFNQGRPIIIAAHSQGTTHAKRLLKDYFENQLLKNRLVCAYLLGMPIEQEYFTSLPVCKDSLSTGCYITWRTFRKGYESDRFVKRETTSVAVVNPLTWSADTAYAPKKLHKGAVLYKFDKVYLATNDAQVHGNMLWISKPRFPWGFLYLSRNYHPGDFNLFYLNIREDVKRRIGLFWKR